MIKPGYVATLTVGIAIGAALASVAPSRSQALVDGPVRQATPEVVLHRFAVRPDQHARLDEWISFLRANHRAAVATLGRERMYVEAMFTIPDDPDRLYWLTVQGRGAPVENSTDPLDRRHVAYMRAVLVPGSHVRFDTRNVLIPDFIGAAIARNETPPQH